MEIANSESSAEKPKGPNQSRACSRAPFAGWPIASAPQRELLNFIDSLVMLIGPCSTHLLTELWLDELACMDRIPEPDSKNWRVVSLAASAKLASKLIALQLRPK